jgi:hypothetical protein
MKPTAGNEPSTDNAPKREYMAIYSFIRNEFVDGTHFLFHE